MAIENLSKRMLKMMGESSTKYISTKNLNRRLHKRHYSKIIHIKMNRLEIKNAVINILQERGFEDADSESLLLESDLELDSLDRVELVMDVEERFGITILELEANGW